MYEIRYRFAGDEDSVSRCDTLLDLARIRRFLATIAAKYVAPVTIVSIKKVS